MKKLLAFLLTLALLTTVGVGAFAEAIDMRVTWWGSQTRHDRTLAAIDLFMEQNPGVTIEPEYTSWDGYWDRMSTQVAANDLPDVMQQDLQYIRQYVSVGQHVDLLPYVESGALDLSNCAESFWSGGVLDGGLYAINLGTNSLMQIYDPVWLEELGVEMLKPGYDWDDYVEFLRLLKSKLPEGVYPSSTLITNQIYNFVTHRARQLGTHFYAEDGKSLGFDVDLLTWCFEFDLMLTNEGLIPPMDVRLEQGTSPEMDLIITKGAVLMETNSNQFIAVQKAANRPLAANIMPVADDQVSNGQYIKPSQFFSVSANSKNIDMAVKFVDFITNSVECNEILLGERGVPISSVVREALKPLLDEYSAIVFDFIGIAGEYADPISPPEPVGHSEVHELLKSIEQEVCFGTATPADAAARFVAEANAILAAK